MKIKLGIFFGGKSVEHEIAVITMSQAISAINPAQGRRSRMSPPPFRFRDASTRHRQSSK